MKQKFVLLRSVQDPFLFFGLKVLLGVGSEDS